MGKEKELNIALSDIYSDLEKLQSAREQVEIVTENGKNLTESTSTLLKELRAFSNQFYEENTSNIKKLIQSLEEFDSKIDLISEKGNKSISKYIELFKKLAIAVIEQFEKTTKDLKVNAEQGIEEVKRNAINEISKTIQHIVDTNSKADKLIDIITNYDIPNSIENLNQKLEVQEKQSKSIKILLFIILGLLGIGGITVIGLLVKFL